MLSRPAGPAHGPRRAGAGQAGRLAQGVLRSPERAVPRARAATGQGKTASWNNSCGGRSAARTRSCAKTLVAHFGQQSPLMKLLNPNESEGLLKALGQTLETQLDDAAQPRAARVFARQQGRGAGANDRRVDQQSRPVDRSAAKEDRHGRRRVFARQGGLGPVSRLVRNVDRAQTTITREFSLDDELGPVALADLQTRAGDRQQPDARRRSSSLARCTRAVRSWKSTRTTGLSGRSQSGAGQDGRPARGGGALDAAWPGLRGRGLRSISNITPSKPATSPARTGQTTGLIKNCKKGDCVVELGPD